MPKPELGVIVGKFYPPHLGHKHLIDVAAGHVQKLVVIVCSKPDETIPGELRASWIREIHPGVDVMRIDDIYDPDDSAVWADRTIHWLGRAPDVAFTSEDYGHRWAGLMGAEHVMVDRDRASVPCSGTEIRAIPLENLHYVEPCVRAFLIPRVVVLGAESTGTSTLAEALAEHYRTVCVPEYGRDYCEDLDDLFNHEWRTEEFIQIAREQNQREDAAASRANGVLVCDTDSFATGVWHERYVGSRSGDVEAFSRFRHYAHYLLTDVDVPFVQDGLRDGESIRHWMHDLFIQRLREAGRAFTVASGGLDDRLRTAIEVVDDVMASVSY